MSTLVTFTCGQCGTIREHHCQVDWRAPVPAASATRLIRERDGAYRERAQLLALLAVHHPAVLAPAPDVDEDGWLILYMRIGGKVATWHIAPGDLELFDHVERVSAGDPRAWWDGHTTEEKYARIQHHVRVIG